MVIRFLSSGRAWCLGGLFFLLGGGLGLIGCTGIKWLAVQTGPTSEKVEAECKLLEGKTVLVCVWAPQEILWDYPKTRLNISSYVSEYLRQNIKGIQLVNALQVESYVEKGDPFRIDSEVLGQHFRADVVVRLDVYQFSIRDPGRAQLYRGRLAAGVVVYDLTQQDETARRIPLTEVRVVYPEEGEIGFSNARPEQVRQATYERFAVEVGKKFHDYQRALD